MATVTPARPHDKTAHVYARLRDEIVTLRLPPGAVLAELELSRRLQASRTPVRAALSRLQQEGLVVTICRGTTTRAAVSPLTAHDMCELFLIAGALDGLAARLAAGLPPEARARVVREMDAINRQLQALAVTRRASEIRRAQQLDVRFHRCYESAASGPRLLAKLHAIHARRERYVRVYTDALVRTGGLEESFREHAAIIDALRRGQPDRAERLAAGNHRNALDRYHRIAAALGERGAWISSNAISHQHPQ